jgi:hypothetical protein
MRQSALVDDDAEKRLQISPLTMTSNLRSFDWHNYTANRVQTQSDLPLYKSAIGAAMQELSATESCGHELSIVCSMVFATIPGVR